MVTFILLLATIGTFVYWLYRRHEDHVAQTLRDQEPTTHQPTATNHRDAA